jgi:hypothetical protein
MLKTKDRVQVVSQAIGWMVRATPGRGLDATRRRARDLAAPRRQPRGGFLGSTRAGIVIANPVRQRGALPRDNQESPMSGTTLLIILVVFLLLGGGWGLSRR